GSGTFEEIPPSSEEMQRRVASVTGFGLPYLVAEIDGGVAGFAYASAFRTRAAYRYTVEDSVYIAPDRLGQGIGKALLLRIIAESETLGLRQMVAMIGDSANAGSIGVHRSCGFAPSGVLKGLGFKAGRWVDVVTMQRELNVGTDTLGPGIDWGGV
ncbi:MAG TPA: GNAT family N-acetyltransferase, partial [Caulobacteraceae bacterium]